MNAENSSKIYGAVQTVLLCIFALAYFADQSRWLFYSAALRLAGAVLCFAGVVLMFAALAVIRRSIQIAPAPRDDAQLVTSGVYSWFRHPIYTAIVLLVIGLFLRKPTIGVAIAAALVVIYLMLKVRIEERLLLARYPEYARYRRETFGLLPWFSARGERGKRTEHNEH